MEVPRVVAETPWTLQELKDALIAEFPILATESGLCGVKWTFLNCFSFSFHKLVFFWFFSLTSVFWFSFDNVRSLGRRNRAKHMSCTMASEIFSGRSAIYHGFKNKGYDASRFDCRANPMDNIHTKEGIFKAASLLVHVDPDGGCAIVEPTCSSWIWICRATTLRSVAPCCNNKCGLERR